MAQHGGGVAELAHFFQAVADIEHRAALAREPAQGLEQPLGLLRRQHGGRLVHDEQARALQQAADDLDTLAHAHRQAGHPRRRVERQPVGLRNGPDIGGEPAPRRVPRQRERDVLGDGEPFEEREMLEHHADAERARLGRITDGRRPALPVHGARVRLERAIEYFHKRRLAGAVFAEKRVDLARMHGEVDAVVRDEAAKALDDAARLQKDISARHVRSFPKQGRPTLGPAAGSVNPESGPPARQPARGSAGDRRYQSSRTPAAR